MNATQIKADRLIKQATDYINSVEGVFDGYPAVTLIIDNIPMSEFEEIANALKKAPEYSDTFKCLQLLNIASQVTVFYHSVPVKAKVVYE